MAGSSVPSLTFGPNGFVAPSQPEILAGVQADTNAAFGGNLNPALNTAQGQLAVSETATIGDNYDKQALLFNSVDPAYASGRMQDAIARIYFLERMPAEPTVVQATCTGLPGTIIPINAIAVATDGNLYATLASTTIPVGGSVSISFACLTYGPIACPATTLNQIYKAVPGWDTVSNPADGVLGSNVESRAAFEARRAASVALNAIGVLPAIRAAVLNVPGVLDVYTTENDTGSPVTIGGVSIAAHSLYVCVSGGAAQAVAQAIWSKKNPGCGYTGNTTETVYDTAAPYVAPYPSYSVTFQTPTDEEVVFLVTLVNNSSVPSDAQAQVAAAIQNAFAGNDGGPRATIGGTIYASRFYGAVAALGSWVQLVSIFIGSLNAPDVSFTAAISATTMTVSAVSSGTFVVGQFIFGADVLPGTYITAFLGGSGGTGTYTLNNSQTVGSEAMDAVGAIQTSVTMDIDQAPVMAAPDVQLVLQ